MEYTLMMVGQQQAFGNDLERWHNKLIGSVWNDGI